MVTRTAMCVIVDKRGGGVNSSSDNSLRETTSMIRLAYKYQHNDSNTYTHIDLRSFISENAFFAIKMIEHCISSTKGHGFEPYKHAY